MSDPVLLVRRDCPVCGGSSLRSLVVEPFTAGPARDFLLTYYRGRVDLSTGRVYSAPLYDTGDERYLWLNAIQAVAKGTTDGTNLEYQIYEVR